MQPRSRRFQLLGASDCKNPSAISREQILLWEQQGVIEYLGEVQDVRPYLESASCVVLPSSYKEGVPRVLLEAMSMGKPIITTNIAGCKECIAPPYTAHANLLIGSNGILIPPRDTNALILAISLLTPELLRQMGASARAFVKSRFCISRIITHYIAATHLSAQSSPDTKNHPKSSNDPQKYSIASNTPKTTSPALAFISNTCFGMYNFRLQVLQSLQQSGFTIHIIAPFDSSASALEQEGFILHNLHVDSRSLNPIKDFRTITALHTLLKHIRPALVFNYTIKPAIYSSSICNILRIPNIAVITGLGYVFINDKGDKSSIAKRALRLLVCAMYKYALKGTKEVWFLNNDDKQEFLARRLITQDQGFLLDSEGVDTEYFCSKSKPLPDNQAQEIVFLLVARMLWDKGVGEFVEAAKIVQKSIQNTTQVDSMGSK